MFRLEPRAEASVFMAWFSPLLAVLLTVVCGALLFVAVDKDPLTSLAVFFVEPLKDLNGWAEVGVKVAPLLTIAVGLALCFRAKVFNIGAEGQLIVGAIAAGAFILAVDTDTHGGPLLITAAIMAGALGGMFWAALVAWLRDQFNANEILVSLMLVYVAELLLSYLVHGALRDPDGFGFPQSRLFSDGFLLPSVLQGTRLHLGIVLACWLPYWVGCICHAVFQGSSCRWVVWHLWQPVMQGFHHVVRSGLPCWFPGGWRGSPGLLKSWGPSAS